MCKYALVKYKPHYVCFDCRKTFKRRLIEYMEGEYTKNRKDDPVICPHCGNEMYQIGKDFEAPKQKNIKAWKHVKELYITGIRFFSCGCTGPGYIPKDHDALMTYLEEMKAEYIDHRRFWLHRVEPTNQSEAHFDCKKNCEYLWKIPAEFKTGTRKKRIVDKEKAVDYWNSKIIEIESKIASISPGK